MALNRKMHPRNKYKTPPSFKELALKNEEFRQNAKIDISGKVVIDFKDANALRALTRALLKEDWGLDVVLPPEYLVPTLPLRLNYILWLEDLVAALKLNDSESPVYGIDIGTGASCVYPLLAAKKNGWHMIGTEKNEVCFNHAKQNVSRNSLESLVKVHKANTEAIIEDSILDSAFDPKPQWFHFTMCNPPFYGSEEEVEKTNKSRSTSCPRPPPNNARTGSPNEIVVEGGEVAFVSKMIDDSFKSKEMIRIFTTMLGHKSSVSKIFAYLKTKNIQEVASSEFCQGRVTRWGIAWSHSVQLTCESLSADPVHAKQKPRPPLVYKLPKPKNDSFDTFDSFVSKVKLLMDQLNMEYKCVIKDDKLVGYQVTALNNTWSNQRRKRRDQLRDTTTSGNAASSQLCSDSTNLRAVEIEEPPSKKAKQDEPIPLAVVGLILREEESEEGSFKTLEINWLQGSGGRESSHQIMQYMKNNI